MRRGESRPAPRGGSGRPGQGGGTRRSAPTAAGRPTSAGLAERGHARRPRGDRGQLGPRRRAPRSGREPRPSKALAEGRQPASRRPSLRSAASGHDRPTRGAASGAARPRMKKKVRTRSARSEETPRNEEAPQVEEVPPAEEVPPPAEDVIPNEVTQAEELTGTEEMAAAGLCVTVTHSNEKHDLHVIPQHGSSEPIVQDLAQVVEEAIGVPLPLQKLIFKGKSLKEMETPLSALGIQDGCRIMLIGEKNCPEEEVELKKLKDLEKSVEKIASQLEELNKELSGIQQGFLAKDLQAEALSKLDRRVKGTIEHFMKILEEIDTLILPENFKDSRLKRKGLVKKIQAFLAECDMVEQNICEETERLQSTNLALAN